MVLIKVPFGLLFDSLSVFMAYVSVICPEYPDFVESVGSLDLLFTRPPHDDVMSG